MKFNKSVVGALMFTVLFSGKLACMPTAEDPTVSTTGSTIDTQVRSDISGLGSYSTFSDKLSVLNSVLSYVGGQIISQSVQIEYYEAVKRFDAFARAYKLNKSEIAQLDKFFKSLQVSTLLSSGMDSDINSRISYWENRAKKVGLTPYQRALQRRKNR